MRRSLIITIMIVSVLSLNAVSFRSNELGQKLSDADDVVRDGYFIIEQGDERSLVFDGNEIWSEITVFINESNYDVVRTYKDSGERIVFSYSDGRLVSESHSTEDGETRTSYAYRDGKLVLSITKYPDGSARVTSFLRSSDNGTVIGVSEDGNVRFLSDGYIVQNGEVIQSISPGLVVSGVPTILEDGSIIVEDDGSEYVYSADGKLLKSTSGSCVILYSYVNGVIASTEKTEGIRKTVELYTGGVASEQFIYENGILASHTILSEDGNVTALYSAGRRIAVIYYKKDNRTIDRIEYN